MAARKKNRGKSKDIGKIMADGRAIDRALRLGVKEALRKHKQAGLPIVVWRDGKTVWIPPDEIDLGGRK